MSSFHSDGSPKESAQFVLDEGLMFSSTENSHTLGENRLGPIHIKVDVSRLYPLLSLPCPKCGNDLVVDKFNIVPGWIDTEDFYVQVNGEELRFSGTYIVRCDSPDCKFIFDDYLIDKGYLEFSYQCEPQNEPVVK
jgi:hypothetical protein